MKNIKTPLEVLDEVSIKRKFKSWFDVYRNIKDEGELNMIPQIAATEYANQFKPEWVSVESGVLPSTGLDVLVSDIESGIVSIGWHIEPEGWFVSEKIMNVTHYMPLPQPPQK